MSKQQEPKVVQSPVTHEWYITTKSIYDQEDEELKTEYLTIVGNIYENPELVGDKYATA